nr:hypothetical protein [Amycolatopsis taiwanensis]
MLLLFVVYELIQEDADAAALAMGPGHYRVPRCRARRGTSRSSGTGSAGCPTASTGSSRVTRS